MYLLTSREIDKLKKAGVAVADERWGYNEKERKSGWYYVVPASATKYLVVRESVETLYDEFDSVIGRGDTVVYLVYIDNMLVGDFTARIGSYYDSGDRFLAGLFRKIALWRAMRVLGV